MHAMWAFLLGFLVMLAVGTLVTEPRAFFRALWKTLGMFILVLVIFTVIAVTAQDSVREMINDETAQLFTQGEALLVSLLAPSVEKNDPGAESAATKTWQWWWVVDK